MLKRQIISMLLFYLCTSCGIWISSKKDKGQGGNPEEEIPQNNPQPVETNNDDDGDDIVFPTQVSGAFLVGTTTDNSGNVLVGSEVYIRGNPKVRARSQADGSFKIPVHQEALDFNPGFISIVSKNYLNGELLAVISDPISVNPDDFKDLSLTEKIVTIDFPIQLEPTGNIEAEVETEGEDSDEEIRVYIDGTDFVGIIKNGKVNLNGVPKGKFTLAVKKKGFAPKTIEQVIQVESGKTTKVENTIKINQFTEVFDDSEEFYVEIKDYDGFINANQKDAIQILVTGKPGVRVNFSLENASIIDAKEDYVLAETGKLIVNANAGESGFMFVEAIFSHETQEFKSSDSTIVDLNAPADVSVSIQNLVNATEAVLLVAGSDISHYLFSEASDCSATDYLPLTSTPNFTFSETNTTMNLYGKFRDQAGNESGCLFFEGLKSQFDSANTSENSSNNNSSGDEDSESENNSNNTQTETEPPITFNISLSGNTLNENNSVGFSIGTLSTDGTQPTNSYTYSLVSGDGDTDNSLFQIDSKTLKADISFDFETKSTYSIRVRAVESPSAAASERSFDITVQDVTDYAAPTLDVNLGLAIEPGVQKIFTSSDLTANHGSLAADKIFFKVEAVPTSGSLMKLHKPLYVGDEFTQDDINRGRISYKHHSLKAVDDQVDFSLHEGNEHYADDAAPSNVSSIVISATDYCSVHHDKTNWNDIVVDGVNQICNLNQWNSFAANCTNGATTACAEDFRLRANLDFKNKTFNAISDPGNSVYFQGTFDGGGHLLKNIYSSVSLGQYGVFRRIEPSAEVRDLGIVNFEIINDTAVTGGLSGINYGTIARAFVSGTVTHTGNINEAGGMVGKNFGTIAESYAITNVTGYDQIGGMTGRNGTTPNVEGHIVNSWARSTVTGRFSVGGLAGAFYRGSITHSQSMGTVHGDYQNIGGLVGYLDNVSISNVSSSADVYETGGGGSQLGGLIGRSSGTVSNSFATGDVNGPSSIGGLVGNNYQGSISTSYATGNITGIGGGLVGTNSDATSVIQTSHATGRVISTGHSGGLVEANQGTIQESYATGGAYSTGSGAYNGGLAGSSSVLITKSFSVGHSVVSTSTNSNTGGLLGSGGWNGSQVTQSYADVEVSGVTLVGGLMGTPAKTVTDTYAAGKVRGTNHSVGGFVGNWGSNNISRNFTISDTDTTLGAEGGFLGSSTLPATLANNFWAIDLSPNQTEAYPGLGAASSSGAIEGVTFDQLKTPSTFDGAGWDFTNVWFPADGVNPPKLRGLPSFECLDHMKATAWNEIGSGPYKICSSAQFLDFAQKCSDSDSTTCSEDFVLAHDLDFHLMTFSMVGSSTNPYTGTFDGGNHTLSNITATPAEGDIGVFRVLGTDGVIKDLGVRQVSFTVTGGTSHRVGGLVGANNGTILRSYSKSSKGTVDIQSDSDDVGGLVGFNAGTIDQSWSNVSVQATSNSQQNIGGLVGRSSGVVSRSYSTGTANGETNIGGLIGRTEGVASIKDSYAKATVQGTDNGGGLVGNHSSGTISFSYANSSFAGIGNNVGGLVGISSASIQNSYAIGTVNRSTATNVGGLVGQQDSGTIEQSFTSIEVTGNISVGGFVGLQTGSDASIIKSYSRGKVTGSQNTGGFAGKIENSAMVEDSWTDALVDMESGTNAGGFVGSFDQSTITRSMSSGDLIDLGTTTGGFIGLVTGAVTLVDNYWNTNTCTQTDAYSGLGNASDSNKVEGETTANLYNSSTYNNWNFTDTWLLPNADSQTFPTLNWNL